MAPYIPHDWPPRFKQAEPQPEVREVWLRLASLVTRVLAFGLAAARTMSLRENRKRVRR
jgi:hypothetical protein